MKEIIATFVVINLFMANWSYNGICSCSRSFNMGAFLLCLLAATYSLTALTLLCGGVVGRWIYPCAIALSAVVLWCVSPVRRTLCCIAASLGLVALVTLLCAFFEDASWDGNVYHQKIVALLLYGWNPYHSSDAWTQYYDPWVWHYAKCLEMSAASVAAATGYIEAGKSVNYLLILSASFFAYDFLGNARPDLSAKRKLIITFIAVANPIGVAQSITYYNDFAKYYYLLITIIAAVSLCRARNRAAWLWYCVMFITTLLAIGTKFTAFFEQGVAVAAFMIWLMWQRQWLLLRRVFAVSVAALLIGACVTGFHPYITNLSVAGHPLYPLLGEGAIDIMTPLTPELYAAHGRVYNFLHSLFTPVIPYYAEFRGGFGALMPVMLAVALLVEVRMRKVLPAPFYYISAWVTASCFFYAQSWWARYICQLWLLVPIAAFATCYSSARLAEWLRAILLACTLLTAAAVGFRAARGTATLTLRRQMLYSFTASDGCARVANPTVECRRHFEERGIGVRHIAVDELGDCSLIFFGDKSPWTYPIVDVSRPQYDAFSCRCRRFGMHPERHLGKYFLFDDLQ